jgi:hypothetical protein
LGVQKYGVGLKRVGGREMGKMPCVAMVKIKGQAGPVQFGESVESTCTTCVYTCIYNLQKGCVVICNDCLLFMVSLYVYLSCRGRPATQVNFCSTITISLAIGFEF